MFALVDKNNKVQLGLKKLRWITSGLVAVLDFEQNKGAEVVGKK